MGEEYRGETKASGATDKLQRDVTKTTNAAVSEGKNDVDHVKAVGVGYVEQVKALAQTAIETAQVWFLLASALQARMLTVIVQDIPPCIRRQQITKPF